MFMTPEELAQVPGAPGEAEFGQRTVKTWGWVRRDKQLEQGRIEHYASVLDGLSGVNNNGDVSGKRGKVVKLTQKSTAYTILAHDNDYKIGKQKQNVSAR